MLRNSLHSPRFVKRAALSLALCSGLVLSGSALAQERGLLSEGTDGSFNAAGQAADDSGPGRVEGLSTSGDAQVQGQIGQSVQPVQPSQPLQSDQLGQPRQLGQTLQPGQQLGQPLQPGQPGQPGFAAPRGERQGMQLGVQVEAHEDGLRVVNVREDSAAKKAGLKEGDIIKRFNDQEIRDAQSLQSQVSQMQAGSEAELVVMRDDEEQKLTAKFEENRYSAARPVADDSMRAELEALRAEVKELRSELHSLKQQRQDQSAAPPVTDESSETAESPEAAVENKTPEAAASAEAAGSAEATEAAASEQQPEASEEAEEEKDE